MKRESQHAYSAGNKEVYQDQPLRWHHRVLFIWIYDITASLWTVLTNCRTQTFIDGMGNTFFYQIISFFLISCPIKLLFSFVRKSFYICEEVRCKTLELLEFSFYRVEHLILRLRLSLIQTECHLRTSVKTNC